LIAASFLYWIIRVDVMKTIEQQYFETLAEANRCKPRSRRKTILLHKLVDLNRRRMEIEMRKEKRAA
jgi:hypothetical protein